MKKISILLVTILITLGLAGCSNSKPTPEVDTAVEVTPMSYDFGDIYRDKGIVSTTVIVKNTSPDLIVINRLSTSCGCTTAEMDLSDLKPGESREMIITFDPMVHPDQNGSMTRVVYLQTSDPLQPEIEIDLTGNVI